MFPVLSSAPGCQTARGVMESRTSRVMAAYICKLCDIEGQDLEVSPGQVFCWNCAGEAMITARIVTAGS